MLNPNQNNTSFEFILSSDQLKEMISVENVEARLITNSVEYYDYDEVIEIDEVEMDKLYLCL